MENQSQLVGPVLKCQVCGHDKLDTILKLGHQALVSSYLTKEQLQREETLYPLNWRRCPKCTLVQLDYIVDPQIVFAPEYPYRTGTTQMLIRNFEQLAEVVTADYHLKPTDLVIDIATNDGTLLTGFKAKGMKVLGIEPTDAAKDANSAGIPTIQAFFTAQLAQQVVSEHGSAKVITITNAFAHMNQLHDVLEGIKTLLADDGVFVSESQYLLDAYEQHAFDTIYHEHLRYYSAKSLAYLFKQVGMSLVDAERIAAAGGSIRAYAMKGDKPQSQRLQDLIKAEEEAGLYDEQKLNTFASDAVIAKHKLVKLLLDIKKSDNRIAAIGSPARSNTLLGFARVDTDVIDCAYEIKGSPKIGLYTPGMHIPVLDETQLFQDQPDYALMLSWHIGEELMKKLRELGYKGKFIMPLPEARIVEDI